MARDARTDGEGRAFFCGAILLYAFLIGSCGPEAAPEPPASLQRGTQDAVPGGSTDPAGEISGGGDDQYFPADPPGRGTGPGAGGDPSRATDPNRTALLESCGGLTPETPEALLWQVDMQMPPTTRRGTEPLLGGLIPLNWSAELSGSWSFSGSLSQVVSRLQLDVQSSDSPAGRRNAEEQISGRPGTLTATLVGFEERLEMSFESGDWRDVVCTVPAASRLVHETSAGRVVTEFSPPLPLGVVPTAETARYATELAAERSWQGITARVVESTVAGVAVGRTLAGRVSIRPTTPSAQLSGGRSVTATAAWEMMTVFGTPAQTRSMGLRTSVRWYIDHATKSFQAVVMQTQEGSNSEFSFER
jgi:hypothetical protein